MNAQTLSDALWALLALAGLVLAGAAHLPARPLVRASRLVRRIEASTFGYVAVLVGWMWLGWHLFAR